MRNAVHKRPAAAIFFLLLMAVNFAVEGSLLYGIYARPILRSAAFGSLCSANSSCAHGADKAEGKSCCAKKKATAACGCPCCGDSCPMGDACRCTADGKRSTSADGLFFRVPGCHPAQSSDDGSYLPLSMRLVYIPVEASSTVFSSYLIAMISDCSAPLAGAAPAPPVPPPKPAIA